MSGESTSWKVLALLVGSLTAAIPAYVAYDIWGRGAAPEKRVELRRVPPINPLGDLSSLGDRVTLALKMKDQTLNNIFIAQASLHNVGSAPVLPADYIERLRVSVSRPWKIVTVENSYSWTVQLRWKRVNDNRFEAEPALLNPGDLVWAHVYLTNTTVADTRGKDAPEPQVEWTARIVNLRSFYEPPNYLNQVAARRFGIFVELSGWALPFTVVGALLFQALYLHLLVKSGLLRGWSWSTTALVLGASLLSFAAAESCATYLFGTSLTDLFGVQHSYNAPPIVLHILVLALLWRKARKATSPLA
jgi:hypothetical protein